MKIIKTERLYLDKKCVTLAAALCQCRLSFANKNGIVCLSYLPQSLSVFVSIS